VVIAIGPVLLLQLIALKLLIKQGLKGMPLGRVGKTVAIPVNNLPLQGRPLGQRNRRRIPLLSSLPWQATQFSVARCLALEGSALWATLG